jgi:hypothetical protein
MNTQLVTKVRCRIDSVAEGNRGSSEDRVSRALEEYAAAIDAEVPI